MSQEDAAYAIGVTVKTWGDWERGRRDPYDGNWRKIGEFFEIDPGEIRGTPPAPLGLGADEDRVVEMERRLTDLIETQNDLLRRQSEILERIERAVAAADGATARASDAADGLDAAVQKAIEGLRASSPLPPPEDEAIARPRSRRASKPDPA